MKCHGYCHKEDICCEKSSNAVTSNFEKAKIDKFRSKSKFKICGDGDEIANHMS